MKKSLAWALSLASYLFFVLPVFAATPTPTGTPVNPCPEEQFKILCTLSAANFGSTVGAAITLIFVLAVIIAIFYLIYGGIKWIMSRGDKAQVEEARNHIASAVVGLIIVFLAFFIINIVLRFFLGTTVEKLNLPSLVSPTPGR